MTTASTIAEPLYIAEPLHTDAGRGRRMRWYAAVLVATGLPLLGLPLASSLQLPFRESFLIGLGVFVGGVCHVASTLYFYFDKDARTVMRTMKGRFYLLPAAALLLSVAALIAGATLSLPLTLVSGVFLVHLLWLYYHYQRQNYGLLAFAAASGGRPLPPLTLTLLLLPPVAGALATVPQLLAQGLEMPLPDARWREGLHTAAIAVYGLAGGGTLCLALRHPKVFLQPLVLVFLLIAWGFFLPGLLIDSLEYAFWSYAIAHGLQYLLMVGIVSAQAPRRCLAIAGFTVAAIAGGWCLQRFGGNHALFLCGILLTWVHFVLDARLWRMRDATVRPFLRSRFAFLFNHHA